MGLEVIMIKEQSTMDEKRSKHLEEKQLLNSERGNKYAIRTKANPFTSLGCCYLLGCVKQQRIKLSMIQVKVLSDNTILVYSINKMG